MAKDVGNLYPSVEEIMTVHDLAEYLRIHQTTVYRLANEGRLRGFKLGGSWRFLRTEVMKGLERAHR